MVRGIDLLDRKKGRVSCAYALFPIAVEKYMLKFVVWELKQQRDLIFSCYRDFLRFLINLKSSLTTQLMINTYFAE